MKRFSVTLAVCLLAAGVAAATPTVAISRTEGTWSKYWPQGGEYTLAPNSELAGLIGSSETFQSFCLELSECAYEGYTYDASVNDEALQGGKRWLGEPKGDDGGDMISPETAYLYTQFRAGTLEGYTFELGDERGASARGLQEAIWYLEGESSRTFDELLPASQAFIELAQNADWTTTGSVRVLNLTNPDGSLAQDMLTLATVPAPGAVLLSSVGLGVVGWLKRRRIMPMK